MDDEVITVARIQEACYQFDVDDPTYLVIDYAENWMSQQLRDMLPPREYRQIVEDPQESMDRIMNRRHIRLECRTKGTTSIEYEYKLFEKGHLIATLYVWHDGEKVRTSTDEWPHS